MANGRNAADDTMQVVRTRQELRDALQPFRRRGARIALVPTMGAFHDGHLALMHAARAAADVVVVSLFVNPTQFGDPADLAAYPRNDARDRELAEGAGVGVLFAPSVSTVYPAGFNTTVTVGDVTAPLEGAARGPGHFQGVATVVTKLFNLVQPHAAYFGQKDAQQTLVVRKLVRDLDIPVEVVICPTVREHDGLAMSSRNARLTPEVRAQATALYDALHAIEAAAEQTEARVPSATDLLALGRDRLAARGVMPDAIDYFAAVDADSLQPATVVNGPTLFALAVRFGGVRLIDNVVIRPRS